MSQPTIYQKLRDAVNRIQPQLKGKPQIGLILGSGLGSVVDDLQDISIIPYTDIPHFHGTSIEGHAGKLILGKWEEVRVVCLQGRFHRYEGYTMEEVVFPTRALCSLGIHTLLLTNAAGAINTRYRPGDLMLIDDHINLMGDNPLKGPNPSELGPRFPDLSEAYDIKCREMIQKSARDLEISLHAGVYVGLLGPTYETPAEVRMLRTLGADAVGMSTVPEAIAANHLGVRVAGLSCITNLAAGLSPVKLTHQEVMTVSQVGAEKMKQLLKSVIPQLARNANPLQPDSRELI